MEKHKSHTFYLVVISLIPALGGFLCGYDGVVFGYLQDFAWQASFTSKVSW